MVDGSDQIRHVRAQDSDLFGLIAAWNVGVRQQTHIAVASIRSNPAMRAFYEQLIARGKPRKVAVVACVRKMLTILNAMARSNTPWTPTFETS
jgi:transposase